LWELPERTTHDISPTRAKSEEEAKFSNLCKNAKSGVNPQMAVPTSRVWDFHTYDKANTPMLKNTVGRTQKCNGCNGQSHSKKKNGMAIFPRGAFAPSGNYLPHRLDRPVKYAMWEKHHWGSCGRCRSAQPMTFHPHGLSEKKKHFFQLVQKCKIRGKSANGGSNLPSMGLSTSVENTVGRTQKCNSCNGQSHLNKLNAMAISPRGAIAPRGNY
jgi:hypothetical protein